MELNDESEDRAPRDEDGEPARTGAPADEAEVEAAVEAEIEADVASYESKVAGEEAADEVEMGEEAAAGEPSSREYPRPYEPPLHPIAKRESLLKRARPYYLTAASLLLITRILVYSLRRRRR
jgi:hypothetical protein